MKTDGGWVNISQAAECYGKHRKWVYDQIEQFNIETRKEKNQTRLRLVDLIAHCGEPPSRESDDNVTDNVDDNVKGHKRTPDAKILLQENEYLRNLIALLEADKAERQAREQGWQSERQQFQSSIERLHDIVDRRALPKPRQEGPGLLSRFGQWLQNL